MRCPCAPGPRAVAVVSVLATWMITSSVWAEDPRQGDIATGSAAVEDDPFVGQSALDRTMLVNAALARNRSARAAQAAWQAARATYPPDAAGRRMQAFSMSNTDSVWKQRMLAASKMAEGAKPGYWLEPFRNFQADCPYFIGSREQVARLIASFVQSGIRHIILDAPPSEQEVAEIDAAATPAASA